MLPRRMPLHVIRSVRMRARNGSPRKLGANGFRKGIKSSLAIACRRRGALVKLCRPAPRVDKNAPIIITHGFGHASSATTSLLFILTPNLSRSKVPSIAVPNKTNNDPSKIYLIERLKD